MATIRLAEEAWTQIHQHLFSEPGEHFAFLMASPTSRGEPVFLVSDVLLIPDRDTLAQADGSSVSTEVLVEAVNTAARSGLALIEVHNHGGVRPRFSATDRLGLQEFVPYVLDSLPGRPYGATVWSDEAIYGEYFMPDGSNGVITSIVVVGAGRLRQLVSLDGDDYHSTRFDRQLPWFSQSGQRTLGQLSVGVVGASGTGSHIIELLEKLGVRHFVLVDPDTVEAVNLNRIGYATPADIGSLKVTVARHFLKSASPWAEVIEIAEEVQSRLALDALRGADLLFGCVDNDGARLVVNELAVAYRIPYVDVATGLDVGEAGLIEAGGRVAVVISGGPCLSCMGLIDPVEARFFLDPPDVREQQVALGYVTGLNEPAPAVASLNAQVAAMAVNEFAVWLTGSRPVTPLQELDLLGIAHVVPGQRTVPHRVTRDASCVECSKADLGDRADLERYGRS